MNALSARHMNEILLQYIWTAVHKESENIAQIEYLITWRTLQMDEELQNKVSGRIVDLVKTNKSIVQDIIDRVDCIPFEDLENA